MNGLLHEVTDPAGLSRDDEVDYWGTAIRHCLHVTVKSIIETGRCLTSCKEQTDHGQFGRCLEAAGISPRVAQMFMKVAANPVLSDASTYSQLPASYNSLHLLSQLEENRLEEVITDGTVGPATSHTDIKNLVHREKEMKVRRDNPAPDLPPYRPEFGPPAPVIYECQDCGRRFDPEPLSDEEAATGTCICPECAEGGEGILVPTVDLQNDPEWIRNNPPWIQKVIAYRRERGGSHTRDRVRDYYFTVEQICMAIKVSAYLDAEAISLVPKEDRWGMADWLRKRRTTISQLITALEDIPTTDPIDSGGADLT